MAKLNLKQATQSALFDYAVPIRIYFEDTDAGGVVYHAQYVKFLERARTEWLRSLGYSNTELEQQHGVLFIVSEINLQFLRPARLDELIEVSVVVTELTRVRGVFSQEIRRAEELLLTARITVATVNAKTLKPCEMPPELKRKMAATQQSL
jgi:acyl-CoA thioester hydrolase